MIKRLEEYAQPLAEACAAMPHPGMLAALWKRTAGGLPGGLTVYDCGSGVLLVARRGAAILLGQPNAASRKELAAFLPFAGIRCLYAAESASLPAAGWHGHLLVWMAAPTRKSFGLGRTDGHTVYPTNNYFAAAQLICTGEEETTRNDFYAELCCRRNRGLGQVLAIGSPAAPEACAVCSGPVLSPAPAAAPAGRSLWQKLLARLKKPQTSVAEMLSTVYLSDLYTAPQHRGGGRGAALVKAVRQLAALPAETQQAVVYCAPEMTPFYRRLGFAEGGRLRCWTLDD